MNNETESTSIFIIRSLRTQLGVSVADLRALSWELVARKGAGQTLVGSETLFHAIAHAVSTPSEQEGWRLLTRPRTMLSRPNHFSERGTEGGS
jgi:hypothetical protein